MTFQEAARAIVYGTAGKPINGTETERHQFDDDVVITEWCEYSRLYIAWLDRHDGEHGKARGAGDTRLSAIADLNAELAGD
jgi:hypothetical protein